MRLRFLLTEKTFNRLNNLANLHKWTYLICTKCVVGIFILSFTHNTIKLIRKYTLEGQAGNLIPGLVFKLPHSFCIVCNPISWRFCKYMFTGIVSCGHYPVNHYLFLFFFSFYSFLSSLTYLFFEKIFSPFML